MSHKLHTWYRSVFRKEGGDGTTPHSRVKPSLATSNKPVQGGGGGGGGEKRSANDGKHHDKGTHHGGVMHGGYRKNHR